MGDLSPKMNRSSRSAEESVKNKKELFCQNIKGITGIASVAGISDSASSKLGPDAVRSIDSGHLAVCWPDESPPFGNHVFRDQLESHDKIARNKRCQLLVKGLSFVLPIENLGVFQPKSEHLQIRQNETLLLNDVDNFPNVLVGIWLYHRVGSKSEKDTSVRRVKCQLEKAILTFPFQARTSFWSRHRHNRSASADEPGP